jgi:hypothetical protein
MTTLQKLAASLAAGLVMMIFQAPAGATDNATLTNADEGWAAFKKCSAIREDRARHACFDDVSRAAGYLPDDAPSAKNEFGLRTSPPQQTAKDFGLRAPSPQPADEKPRNNELQVTLTSVTEARDGKLAFTTSDGAQWRQTESGMLGNTPKPGQTMAIEKTSLGGFFCKPPKGPAFRCRRIR